MRLIDLEVLSKNDMELIRNSSLRVLESVGLIVESKKVLDILNDNGCIVD